MSAPNHRAVCAADGCGWVRRENCADCARDMADRHRRETGHPVETVITAGGTWSDLRKVTGLAHAVLVGRKERGGW